ncbi:HelD family protein [Janibacter cremeus]|uniref:UvrD-like helicase ATP-binding domain-containing protein n=1 Tax=Janibacter cremeus TaxID=1285192 RepID=A0A852VQT0_9MICO|nr:AAA family ATPase [Janibacter cremeus]NYF98289.1 hypothetical protein [Janibacter cremeus]
MPDHEITDAAIAQEQQALDIALARRDEAIGELTARLDGLVEEDSVAATARRSTRTRLIELERADSGLVFGRLDALDGEVWRIGRVGVPGQDELDDPLVLDWRAAAARPFYTATAVEPQGQARRRHIRTEGRRVIGVDDEVLDGSGDGGLVGEGALLAALDERRTGRMGTAVATLQREQDDIVRAPSRGALVVQGGPGTGKTVVALHRVAYLLFAHPELARAGVLVLGPSQRFLDYIGSVLPALGETAVVSATCETILPGVRPERTESRRLAEIKGRAGWQDALEQHVASLVPSAQDLPIRWEDEEYVVPRATVERLLRTACSGRDHHSARRAFLAQLIDVATDLVAGGTAELLASAEEGLEDILGSVDASLARDDDRGVTTGEAGAAVDGELTPAEIEALRSRIRADAPFASRLWQWWPDRDPAAELATLLADEETLARVVPGLGAGERALVAAEPAGWAPSDIPLLDAMSDLIGDDGQVGSQAEFTADRASGRRDWVYGHVVVDEAQELSPMEWQMVARRAPGYSITAVGDIDQTEAAHTHTSWEGIVGDVLGERWRQSRLTICYRTPREVMALTGEVLAAAGSDNEPPRAVRSSGIDPWTRQVDEGGLPAATAAAADELARRWTGGTVGVVAPAVRVPGLRAAVRPDVPVVAPTGAKGLEWDAVLVVDPDDIIAEPRGHNGLYVALTRCTQELGQLRVSTTSAQ